MLTTPPAFLFSPPPLHFPLLLFLLLPLLPLLYTRPILSPLLLGPHGPVCGRPDCTRSPDALQVLGHRQSALLLLLRLFLFLLLLRWWLFLLLVLEGRGGGVSGGGEQQGSGGAEVVEGEGGADCDAAGSPCNRTGRHGSKQAQHHRRHLHHHHCHVLYHHHLLHYHHFLLLLTAPASQPGPGIFRRVGGVGIGMRCRRHKTIMLAKVTSARPITARAIVTFCFQKLIFAPGVRPPGDFSPSPRLSRPCSPLPEESTRKRSANEGAGRLSPPVDKTKQSRQRVSRIAQVVSSAVSPSSVLGQRARRMLCAVSG